MAPFNFLLATATVFFLMKLDASGNWLWTKQDGLGMDDDAHAVAVGRLYLSHRVGPANGRLFVGGWCANSGEANLFDELEQQRRKILD